MRAFPLDPVLRSSEVRLPVAIQLADPRTREAAWQWFKEHFDALAAIVPRPHGTVALIDGAEVFCDEAHAADVEAFFTPKRVAEIDGAPRALANTLETIRLCAAKRAVQEPSARAFFAQHR